MKTLMLLIALSFPLGCPMIEEINEPPVDVVEKPTRPKPRSPAPTGRIVKDPCDALKGSDRDQCILKQKGGIIIKKR